jgi:exodeoxyribonuclease VII large subunit
MQPDLKEKKPTNVSLMPAMKVSELVLLLKSELEEKHRFVKIVGELSSFKQWQSGHCYFDIKDEKSMISAVMFRPHFEKLKFTVQSGQEMIFYGRVSVYAPNSRVQVMVESMEPLGQGALALAFNQLKERLLAEGLFDARHKVPIAFLNQRIGLITSLNGAALRDMLRIIKSRMPKTDILLAPVRVQGAGAKEEIAAAIERMDNYGNCDVIILGRGGGSLEDLWAFNEEIVARAIFKARTPLVSAVGHETDNSISDMVADLRAATPSHAAQIVCPVEAELVGLIESFCGRLKNSTQAILQEKWLLTLALKQKMSDPRFMLFRHWQELDVLSRKLRDNIKTQVRLKKDNLNRLDKLLELLSPKIQIRAKKDAFLALKNRMNKYNISSNLLRERGQISTLEQRLYTAIKERITKSRSYFREALSSLEALSPLKVLCRGFVMVTNSDNQLVATVAKVSIGDELTLTFQDGHAKTRIIAKDS